MSNRNEVVLAPSKAMTRQEIFDKVARHLLTQNRKAETSYSDGAFMRCQYRTKEGLKCAVGCLIPDNLYHDDLEGHSITKLLSSELNDEVYDYQLDEMLGRDIDFLERLQKIHDEMDVNGWKEALREVAKGFAINTKVLREFTL